MTDQLHVQRVVHMATNTNQRAVHPAWLALCASGWTAPWTRTNDPTKVTCGWCREELAVLAELRLAGLLDEYMARKLGGWL